MGWLSFPTGSWCWAPARFWVVEALIPILRSLHRWRVIRLGNERWLLAHHSTDVHNSQSYIHRRVLLSAFQDEGLWTSCLGLKLYWLPFHLLSLPEQGLYSSSPQSKLGVVRCVGVPQDLLLTLYNIFDFFSTSLDVYTWGLHQDSRPEVILFPS